MRTKSEVQARVWEYLREHNLSVSELARRAGVPGATLNRMLRDDPTYKGRPDHWAQLARYGPLHLREAETLAAVGLGPAPEHSTEDADPWSLLEKVMRLLNLPEEHRVHLRGQLRLLARGVEAERRLQSSDAP